MNKRFGDTTASPFKTSTTKTKIVYNEYIDPRGESDDYTAFDLERFKNELMDKFIRDTNDIASENDRVKRDALSKIQEYENTHIADRELNLGEDNFIYQRKSIAESISKASSDFDKTTTEATKEKRKLREEMADLEDSLRKVRDQLAETELENTNFQTIVDAVKDIQANQKSAELNALRTINLDLKDQIAKLEHDLDFASGPTDTHNIKYGLEEKYKSAKSDFNSFIAEAELGK